jgi:hypothetical protein
VYTLVKSLIMFYDIFELQNLNRFVCKPSIACKVILITLRVSLMLNVLT